MRILRSPTFWIGIIVVSAYALIAANFPSRHVQEILRIIALSVGFGVAMAFAPYFWSSMRKPHSHLDPGDILTMSIWLLAAGLTALAGWSLLWRLAGQPAWMQNNDLPGFFLLIIVCALTMVLSAPGLIDGQIPPRNRIRIAVWWGVGAAIAAYIVAAQPNIAGFMNHFRPYLEEPDSDYLNPEGVPQSKVLSLHTSAKDFLQGPR